MAKLLGDWGVVLTSVIILFRLPDSDSVTVYGKKNFQGETEKINLSKCTNLSNKLSGKIGSISMSNIGCARLHEKKNCLGESIELTTASPYQEDLIGLRLDKALSIGPCTDNCYAKPKTNEPRDIVIYTKSDYEGKSSPVPIKGCTRVKIEPVKSIHTFGQCVQLYDNVRCEMKTGNGMSMWEIRPNAYFTDDLDKWKNYNGTRAISFCEFSCTKNSSSDKVSTENDKVLPTTVKTTMKTTTTKMTTTLRPKPDTQSRKIFIFNGKNFLGKSFQVDIENTKCIEIFSELGSEAQSLKLGESACVTLYEKTKCTGKSQYVAASVNDLFVTRSKLGGIPRSLRTCDKRKPATGGSKRPVLSAGLIGALVAIFVVMVIVVVVIVLFVRRKYQNRMRLSEKEIKEFLNGLEIDIEKNNHRSNPPRDYSVELMAQSKPYNKALDVDRVQISYDEKSPLGMGAYGVVYKGAARLLAKSEPGLGSGFKTVPVAIKAVKPDTGAQHLRSLMKEVKVMMYLGNNAHIAEMLGCCVENLQKGEILVLMEYCSYGNLETFLHKNRHDFAIKMFDSDEVDEDVDIDIESIESDERKLSFDYIQLLKWCIEISQGMEFLARSKVVHSDLSAGRVLLTNNLQAKIADFGLSRQFHIYSQSAKKHQEPKYWRWMAIESLKKLEFTSQSDIWSFGIVCWEIFTLGEKPYQILSWSDDFAEKLEQGLRPSKPIHATAECYNLLLRCWAAVPRARPSFTEIIEELNKCQQF